MSDDEMDPGEFAPGTLIRMLLTEAAAIHPCTHLSCDCDIRRRQLRAAARRLREEMERAARGPWQSPDALAVLTRLNGAPLVTP